MTYPLFSFTSTPQGQDPSSQAGLNQYIQQGQSQINPGQAQVAASNPITAGGQQGLEAALKAAFQQGPQGSVDPSQAALTNGAQMQPNSPSGQNMGGVGPTVNNSQALANYQGMTTNPGLSAAQKIANFLSGGNG